MKAKWSLRTIVALFLVGDLTVSILLLWWYFTRVLP